MTTTQSAREEVLARIRTALADRPEPLPVVRSYRTAGTLPGRIPPATMLRWPRIGVYHRDDERRFRRKLNPAVRALRSSPLWSVAELARSLRPDRAQGPAT